LELSDEIRDLTIWYLLNYDKKFQSIQETKILYSSINFEKELEKLPKQHKKK
jgi:hypothetical protein